jgi:hypothetical protein
VDRRGVTRQNARVVPAWTIDPRFDTAENAEVLAYLRRESPSAHSDVAEELARAGEDVPGLAVWCPEPASYAFVALHRTDGTIVGLARGMTGLSLRLPPERVDEAVREGATPDPALGSGWVRLAPWTGAEPLAASRRRLARWAAVAAGADAS